MITVLSAFRERLGPRATVAQAIALLELARAGDDGMTVGEMKTAAGTGSPSSSFASSLVASGLARRAYRCLRKVPVLKADPRVLELLNQPAPL